LLLSSFLYFFFFNHPPPSEIYTLSLHDALPILTIVRSTMAPASMLVGTRTVRVFTATRWKAFGPACAFFWTASRVSANASCTSEDRKSTRLNSSHVAISYAVFCLKKKKKQ